MPHVENRLIDRPIAHNQRVTPNDARERGALADKLLQDGVSERVPALSTEEQYAVLGVEHDGLVLALRAWRVGLLNDKSVMPAGHLLTMRRQDVTCPLTSLATMSSIERNGAGSCLARRVNT